MDKTQIWISKRTKKKLQSQPEYKIKGETFDSVILRLLERSKILKKMEE